MKTSWGHEVGVDKFGYKNKVPKISRPDYQIDDPYYPPDGPHDHYEENPPTHYPADYHDEYYPYPPQHGEYYNHYAGAENDGEEA